MFLKPRAGGGRSRHRFARGVEGWVLRSRGLPFATPFRRSRFGIFILAREDSAHPLRDSFKVEKMVKQSRSITVIPSTFLCALLVFGNVVSAFGNVPASRKARAKSQPAATKEAPRPSESAAGTAQPTGKGKPVFTKVGEPFVVET